ncbi:MAG: metallopeptidase TldD-related protein [Planctomycetes bacterium]|nr:metallopeptidase TldD-related protein [Planctomycetota bacterium]
MAAAPAAEARIDECFHADAALLERLLSEAVSRGADFADLYFERREEWNLLLEQDVLRTASSGVMAGMGVHVLCGERTGYAFTEDFTPESMMRAARTASLIAAGGGAAPVIRLRDRPVRDLYPAGAVPPGAASGDGFAHRVDLLRRASAAARGKEPRVTRVVAALRDEVKTVAVVTGEGGIFRDRQPMLTFYVLVVAEEAGRGRVQAHDSGGCRMGLEYFDRKPPEEFGREAARRAGLALGADPAPAGSLPVVLGPGASGVLLHEAVGHPLEADFNRKGLSRFCNRMGEKVASSLCTIVDDGTVASSRGSLNVDDEGNATSSTTLIENGVLVGFMQDRLSSRLTGAKPTGNGRRQSYAHPPIPRMTNTYLPPGPHRPEEILRSVKRGVYAADFLGGQVDIAKGDFVFSASEAYLIEDGAITRPLRGMTLIGNGPDVMGRVEMVGNDYRLSGQAGMCGKEGQLVPVDFGIPTVKISSITVGGTEG